MMPCDDVCGETFLEREPQRCPHGRTFAQTCEPCGRSVVAFTDPVILSCAPRFRVVRG